MDARTQAAIKRIFAKLGLNYELAGNPDAEPVEVSLRDVVEALEAAYRAGARTREPDAAALGRRGGSVTSEAKVEAVRLNGMKGGRPRKVKP